MKYSFPAACILATAIAAHLSAAETPKLLLEKGDLLAICGDSITEQKMYSVYMEDYLLACQPGGVAGLRSLQEGWGGETARGFRNRMELDTLPLKPSAATTCYGMNDGSYRPLDKNISDGYRAGMTDTVKTFKSHGVRVIIAGSPGAVDSDTFHREAASADVYNVNLAGLRDIAREVATQEGVLFADVHEPLMQAMEKAKAKYGHAYAVCGGDGVHPDANGHLVMAYAFLKALGCDGDIGTITLDLAAGSATGTAGHVINSVSNGEVTVTSSRYPFCFTGDPKDSHATSGIIEFFPFNQDLNRFTLIVKNGGAGQLNVTWGKQTKTFDAAALEKGINLAEQFLDNPFVPVFQKLDQAVRDKQNSETSLIKDQLIALGRLITAAPEETESLNRIREKLLAKDATYSQAVAALVQPLQYIVKVEAVK